MIVVAESEDPPTARTNGWTEAAFGSSVLVGLSCRRSVTRVVRGLHHLDALRP
jgi:hypothetical protein